MIKRDRFSFVWEFLLQWNESDRICFLLINVHSISHGYLFRFQYEIETAYGWKVFECKKKKFALGLTKFLFSLDVWIYDSRINKSYTILIGIKMELSPPFSVRVAENENGMSWICFWIVTTVQRTNNPIYTCQHATINK